VLTAFLVLATHSAILEGQSRSLVADVVPRERRATAFGVYHTAVGLGLLPASLAAGMLWSASARRRRSRSGACWRSPRRSRFVVLLPPGGEARERHCLRAAPSSSASRRCSRHSPRARAWSWGPGDDAAVLRPRDGRDLVATTDAFVEGRHFRRDLLTPAEAGARLAVANLSDLAAMAAEPRWALLSFVVPAAWSQAECMLLERASARMLAADGAAIVGGNLAAAEGPFSATLALLGEVERGAAWRRAGAKPAT
jgi:hypothetical protein